MTGLSPVTDESDESVSLTSVMSASVAIYEEWENAESDASRDADERALTDAERVAYQEGLLRALELLNSRTGVTIETMNADARERLGVDPARDGRDPRRRDEFEPDELGDCENCGTEKRHEMGASGGFCPNCDV